MLITASQTDMIAAACLNLEAQIPHEGIHTARDWAGFFAGLAALLQVLLPIIIPLFMEPKSE